MKEQKLTIRRFAGEIGFVHPLTDEVLEQLIQLAVDRAVKAAMIDFATGLAEEYSRAKRPASAAVLRNLLQKRSWQERHTPEEHASEDARSCSRCGEALLAVPGESVVIALRRTDGEYHYPPGSLFCRDCFFDTSTSDQQPTQPHDVGAACVFDPAILSGTVPPKSRCCKAEVIDCDGRATCSACRLTSDA